MTPPRVRSSVPPSSLSKLNNLQYFKDNKGHPCIYFLVKNNEVVYVGKSTYLMQRVLTHQVNRQKDFDEVFWLSVPQEELGETEKAFIRLLRPRYNLVGHAGIPYRDKEIIAQLEIPIFPEKNSDRP